MIIFTKGALEQRRKKARKKTSQQEKEKSLRESGAKHIEHLVSGFLRNQDWWLLNNQQERIGEKLINIIINHTVYGFSLKPIRHTSNDFGTYWNICTIYQGYDILCNPLGPIIKISRNSTKENDFETAIGNGIKEITSETSIGEYIFTQYDQYFAYSNNIEKSVICISCTENASLYNKSDNSLHDDGILVRQVSISNISKDYYVTTSDSANDFLRPIRGKYRNSVILSAVSKQYLKFGVLDKDFMQALRNRRIRLHGIDTSACAHCVAFQMMQTTTQCSPCDTGPKKLTICTY